MYNIFISYRRDGGYEMARLLYEHLKNAGYNPFFDLEELRSGPFNVRLYKTIDECSNFLLVLPKGALKRCANSDDWLRLEIERAMKGNKNIIPVMMSGFDWEDLPECLEGLSNYNAVIMSRDYFSASISKIVSMLKDVSVTSSSNKVYEQKREENPYFSFKDKKEMARLETQQKLMKTFDRDTYDRVARSYDSLRILDIGSNNGDFIMDRLGSSDNTEKLIGVEYDDATVAAANKKYGKAGKISFIQANVESEELMPALEKVMQECNIESFNVLNISMVLLHLKNPHRLLKTLRSVLERGATVIIKDIDDGYNIAYPDDKGDFARVISICARNETSGYRSSGRQIYSLLKLAGYRDCTLEKLGMTTVGMDYDEKNALFDTYFSFIPEDLKIMVERYPEDRTLQNDLKWINGIYDDLEERFQSDNFFFSLGFMLYTAKR